MTARHHHYLSQCYLKGFTKGKSKNSKLVVIDLKSKKSFETIPRNVGGIRDFNRIDIEGEDQNVFETALSDIEGNIARALKNLEDSSDFSGETKELILFLVAMIAVRSPQRRAHMAQFEVEVIEGVMRMALESKKDWLANEEDRRRNIPNYNSDVTYEELKAFFDSKEYKIKISNEHHIRMEFEQINAILPYLQGRRWILIKASERSGPFITTDNPTLLTWKNPENIPAFYRSSPGFGMLDTQVYFPISSDLAILGEFNSDERVVSDQPGLIPLFNTKLLGGTYKQVYSSKMGFFLVSRNGRIIDGNRLFAEVVERP